MRDQLLGHLLGALDDDERDSVSRELGDNPQAQRELALLRRAVEPLAADAGHDAPPAGLAARTCSFVFAQHGPVSRPAAVSPAALPVREAGMLRRNWRAIDMAVALGAIAAAALLFFPALVNSRFLAQMDGCQNNLATLHTALAGYANSNIEGGLYPRIPERGNDAVAGVYAVKLREAGYLDSPSHLVCPSSALAKAGVAPAPITRAQLAAATGDNLSQLQRSIGGSYGYSLGYQLRDAAGRYRGHVPAGDRRLADRRYPILADAHEDPLSGSNSANHGGAGQNVLFSDGTVAYLSTVRLKDENDNTQAFDANIFRNDENEVAAGINLLDSVLGGSSSSPWKK